MFLDINVNKGAWSRLWMLIIAAVIERCFGGREAFQGWGSFFEKKWENSFILLKNKCLG
jgi:hypothetical protein